MLFELNTIFSQTQLAQKKGVKVALASVVALDGSSYRRPGVRMAVLETGEMIGAVSGGCVEKEVLRQAQSVFESNTPKLMTYDGRYRLGCEGILYILIEPFNPEKAFFEAFANQQKNRSAFRITTYYDKAEENRTKGGSVFHFSDGTYSSTPSLTEDTSLEQCTETVAPAFRLFIVGAEHDAVTLCSFAAQTGWEVHVIAPPDDPKTIANFPGAHAYHGIDELHFKAIEIDQQTAVVLMTHSFVKDLKYLSALLDKDIRYIGLLGPSKRREKLIDELLAYHPEIEEDFIARLYGPCGINIGAETPQEIALSIIAEILSVYRNQKTIPLKDKTKGIHQ